VADQLKLRLHEAPRQPTRRAELRTRGGANDVGWHRIFKGRARNAAACVFNDVDHGVLGSRRVAG